MNLVRKYKLFKLGISQEPNLNNIFNFLDNRLSGLRAIVFYDTPNWVLYTDAGNNWIFEYCIPIKHINFRHEYFLDVLAWHYNMEEYDNSERDELLKDVMNRKFKFQTVKVGESVCPETKDCEIEYRMKKHMFRYVDSQEI